jgi:hypothetical protein
MQEQDRISYRPKGLSDATGIPVGTLARWRQTRSDGPVFCKFEGVILYPVEANRQWLESLPVYRNTAQCA